jgi:mono/diheme cytochrome c family protein
MRLARIGVLGILLLGPGTAARAAEPSTAARVARGSYLVNGVARCFWCHSPLDAGDPARPKPNTLGSGDILDAKIPIFAPNITPDRETGIGGWTDAEIARAIRNGIGRNGRALRSDHPATYYSVMTDSDLASVIAYLRSLAPIRRRLARSAPERVPGSPIQAAVVPASDTELTTPVRRGAYLVQLGECCGCHSPSRAENPSFAQMLFAGGRRFYIEKGVGLELFGDPPKGAPVVTSMNLTPDASGIPYYTRAIFIQTIRTGRVAGVRQLSAAMPWIYFRTMTDLDLSDVFAYLQTLPPVRHRVDNTTPPTPCRKCGTAHGLGDLN